MVVVFDVHLAQLKVTGTLVFYLCTSSGKVLFEIVYLV
jgi:hypothetical protein